MNIRKSLISISSVTAILLLTACSSSSTDRTTDLSGTVVDGYVSNADVTIGETSTQTDAAGVWSIQNVAVSSNMTVEASGGIDTSTGEVFEGKLKAIINEEKSDVVLTPISTVVASMVTSGSTLDEATQKVSQELNISTDSLKTDPIAILKDTNSTTEEKEHAAIVLKKSLVFQKMAETVSSVGTTSEEHNQIFDEVVNSFSNKLAESNTTFDEVLADTASITASVATNLEKNDGADENLRAKLEASAPSAAQTVKSVEAIDEKVFSEATDVDTVIKTQSKAIEVVTSAVETGVEQISKSIDESAAEAAAAELAAAQAQEALNAAIAAAKAEAEKTAQAITMLGGVEGVAVALEKEAAVQAANTTTDASTFSESLFSTENIKAQSDIYKQLEVSGMTEEMITSVGTGISAKQDTQTPVDFTKVVEDVINATPDVTIDAAVKEAITTAVKDSSEAAVTAATAAAAESSYDTTDTGARTISANGSTEANAVAETFTITPEENGTYTHTISNFDPRVDKLDFGTGVNSSQLPIMNTTDDGKAELYYTPDAGLTNVYVILEGLTKAQDIALTTSAGVDAILKK